MDKRNISIKIITVVFAVTLFVIACIFALSIIKTDRYNKKTHQYAADGEKLFAAVDNSSVDVSVRVEPRSSTWSKGYPEGKKGEDIPLIARMICVADSYDAMNSNRVYRNKITKEDIVNEIEKNKGTQFDSVITDVFLKLLKSGRI